MDWAHNKCDVCFTTVLLYNQVLIKKQKKRADNDLKKTNKEVKRYFKLDYKAKTWEFEQRVITKVEVNDKGINIRFEVSSNRNNTPQTIYRHYCKRGLMEL